MDDLYRQIIIERYKTPLYRGELDPHDISFEDENPLCGDHIRIDLRVDDSRAPLPEMLELIPTAAPGAFAILGNAEIIPLPDAHADVVTCAQSFHWFDHAVALPEIERVLRPKGRLSLVWPRQAAPNERNRLHGPHPASP